MINEDTPYVARLKHASTSGAMAAALKIKRSHAADCVCNVCDNCPDCDNGTRGPAGTYCQRCHRTQRPIPTPGEGAR